MFTKLRKVKIFSILIVPEYYKNFNFVFEFNLLYNTVRYMYFKRKKLGF